MENMDSSILKIIKKAKDIPGALSLAEMYGLAKTITEKIDCVDTLNAIDLGSHVGKSAFVALSALSVIDRNDYFELVDPIYSEDYPEEWEKVIKEDITRDALILRVYGLLDSIPGSDVLLYGEKSIIYLEMYFEEDRQEDSVSYVFIDTADHELELVMKEVELLEDVVSPGGLIFFHDYGNYPGPLKAAEYLVNTGKYEYIDINWEEAIEFLETNGLDESQNNSWHKFEDVKNPCYLGCVRRL